MILIPVIKFHVDAEVIKEQKSLLFIWCTLFRKHIYCRVLGGATKSFNGITVSNKMIFFIQSDTNYTLNCIEFENKVMFVVRKYGL